MTPPMICLVDNCSLSTNVDTKKFIEIQPADINGNITEACILDESTITKKFAIAFESPEIVEYGYTSFNSENITFLSNLNNHIK